MASIVQWRILDALGAVVGGGSSGGSSRSLDLHDMRPRFYGPPPQSGFSPHVLGVRNGQEPSASQMRLFAAAINDVSAKLTRRVFSAHYELAETDDPVAASGNVKFRFRASPAAVEVRFDVGCYSSNTTVSADVPAYYWQVNAANTPTITINARHAPSTTPTDIVLTSTTYTVTPGTAYQCVFTPSAHCRVAWIQVYEVPRRWIASSETCAVATDQIAQGLIVHDSTVGRMISVLDGLWKSQGQHFVWWSPAKNVAKTMVGATYTNLIDGTTVGTNAAAPGVYAWPQYQGSYQRAGIVPVECYAYMGASAGTAYVKFSDSSGDICELSTASAAAWVTATADWTQSSSVKVDILAKNIGGGTTSCWAAGMYSYSA